MHENDIKKFVLNHDRSEYRKQVTARKRRNSSSDHEQLQRIFLGIPIPDAVGIELLQMFDKHNPMAPHDRFRKLTLEQLHLTVHFFGRVVLKKLDCFQQTLQSYLKTCRPFEARILRIARFPHSRSNLIAADVEASSELVKLHNDVHNMINETFLTKQLSVRSDHLVSTQFNLEQTYRPHITLCRVKGKNKIIINDCVFKKSFKISELIFYESKPSSAGSQYIILKRLFLG